MKLSIGVTGAAYPILSNRAHSETIVLLRGRRQRIGSLLSNLSPSLVSGSEIVWRKEKSPNGKRSSVWDGRRQKNAAATAEYKGKTYYFCCNACKAKFQQAPEQYLKT